MKSLKIIAVAALLFAIATGCNPSDKEKKIGGSVDTASINKAGGPPISDTATINNNRKESTQDSITGDTTAKGNADPSGRLKKSN